MLRRVENEQQLSNHGLARNLKKHFIEVLELKLLDQCGISARKSFPVAKSAGTSDSSFFFISMLE